MKLTTAQIGRCGELLVQYALPSRGVESAPMSTDTGIDLMSERRIWMFTHEQLIHAAQQKPSSGKLHIFMKVTMPARQRKDGKPQHIKQFDGFLLENRMADLFRI